MKISTIIPIYQFNDELFKLSRQMFLSLDETESDDEIEKIVIDNGSPTGGSYLQQEADIYIHNRENLGYCKAVNQGFKLATGDLLVVGNNDIKVSPNFLNVAKKILKDNSKVGSVHFRMIPYLQEFNPGQNIWITGKERWCHASLYVIRKEAIPEGGYVTKFGMGGFDDYEFFYRMRNINGWQQAYTNRAEFAHNDSSTYRALDNRDHDRDERDARNKEIYKQIHGEYPDQQFARLYPEQMSVPWLPFP